MNLNKDDLVEHLVYPKLGIGKVIRTNGVIAAIRWPNPIGEKLHDIYLLKLVYEG